MIEVINLGIVFHLYGFLGASFALLAAILWIDAQKATTRIIRAATSKTRLIIQWV